MRIEFIRAARESFSWTQAQLRMGSAPGNDLILAADQAAAEHLSIDCDARGWVLRVTPGAARIYVNARPVHEQTLLRPGDVVSVGDCRMLLCADEVPERRPLPPAVSDPASCTAALRAVAGPLSGRVFPVHEFLEFGPRGRHALELPQGEAGSFRIGWHDGRLTLSAEQSGQHPLRVNGNPVTKAVLQSGDQIGIAMHRFVLEAPGIKMEQEQAKPPPPPPVHAPETASHAGAGWLILTAAILALGIALLFLVRF